MDADGKFEVWLERGGNYSASIQERRNGAGVTLGRSVAFENRDEEVEIDLPSVRLRGRVREGAAAPSSNVTVTATQLLADPAGYVFARAESDGRFVLEGLSPGTWEAIAESSGARSEPVTISVGESDVENIELDVEPVRKTKIRIVDTTGVPIRDAFVSVEVPRADAMSPRPQIRTTNEHGVAEFRLTAALQTTPVNIVVATLDVHLSCDVRRLDADQTIPIEPAAGVVRLTGREWASMGSVQPWLVSSRGCAVPLLGTRLERESSGESAIVFPRLAAGSWTYVETHTPAEVAAVLTGKASALRALTRFEVTPGAIARVRLPSQ
jgi:hypothetical protein